MKTLKELSSIEMNVIRGGNETFTTKSGKVIYTNEGTCGETYTNIYHDNGTWLKLQRVALKCPTIPTDTIN